MAARKKLGEPKPKVFCRTCKHFSASEWLIMDEQCRCRHPREAEDTWLDERHKYNTLCSDKNIDNDCPDFERALAYELVESKPKAPAEASHPLMRLWAMLCGR